MGARRGRWDKNELIEFGWGGAKPSGMPDRSSSLALRLRVAWSRFVRDVLVLGIATADELLLSLQLEFQPDLRQLVSQPLVFRPELPISLALGIQLAVQPIQILALVTRRVDESGQRGASQVRTMSDLGAGVFVVWIEAKIHRHPFLGCRQPNPTPPQLPRAISAGRRRGSRRRSRPGEQNGRSEN